MVEKIGIISNYIPEELVEIFGTPHRVIGNFGDIPVPFLPSFTCSYVRELVTAFNSGELDFLSGLIIPQSCDSLYAAKDLLKRTDKFVYRLSTPNQYTEASLQYNTMQLKQFVDFLESKFSTGFDEAKLQEIIKVGNRIRRLLQDIAELILKENKNIHYGNFLSLIQKVMQDKFESIEEELARKHAAFKDFETLSSIRRKVMLIGPIVDNYEIINIIERFENTKIVLDNITNGRRYFDGIIAEDIDPLKAISTYYLGKIHSPTFHNKEYVEIIRRAIKDSNINCMIMINQRGCEPHDFYIPKIKQVCNDGKINFLVLNIEHAEPSLDKIKLKIESFLEMI
jgi:benzoyl-CoA reductase/2-hydroxyglutaryl-CoA dehydratase subunit BcrC/BadD/HgdB